MPLPTEKKKVLYYRRRSKKDSEFVLLLQMHIHSPQAPSMGSLSSQCLSEPVPKSLLTLLRVLLEDASSVHNAGSTRLSARTCVACNLSQLLISNAAKHATNARTSNRRVRERHECFSIRACSYMLMIV